MCLRLLLVQGNLLKHISRMGSLSEAHIVQNVMQPLLQALQHLHAQVSWKNAPSDSPMHALCRCKCCLV